MAAPVAVQSPVVGRLELVVALLGDPLAELAQERLDLDAGDQLAEHRREQAQVAHVGLDGLGDARVLDLDRDLGARRGSGRGRPGRCWRRRPARCRSRRGRRRPGGPTRSRGACASASSRPGGRCRAGRPAGPAGRRPGRRSRPGNSTVERTWPAFIAAPRITASWSTRASMVATIRSPRRRRGSGGVPRPSSRSPAQRTAPPAATLPSRAVRALRPCVGPAAAPAASTSASDQPPGGVVVLGVVVVGGHVQSLAKARRPTAGRGSAA